MTWKICRIQISEDLNFHLSLGSGKLKDRIPPLQVFIGHIAVTKAILVGRGYNLVEDLGPHDMAGWLDARHERATDLLVSESLWILVVAQLRASHLAAFGAVIPLSAQDRLDTQIGDLIKDIVSFPFAIEVAYAGMMTAEYMAGASHIFAYNGAENGASGTFVAYIPQ